MIAVFLLNSQIVFAQWDHTYQLTSLRTVGSSDFSFSSTQNGYLAYVYYGTQGDDDELVISKTNDFGVSWEICSSESAQSLDVGKILTSGKDTVYCFINYVHGGLCRYSYDGGNHWSDLVFPGYGTWAYDALLLNEETIIFTSAQGRVFKYSQDNSYTFIEDESVDFSNSKIIFVNSNIAYIKANDLLNNDILLFSNNGGSSWETSFTTNEYQINDLFFTSDSVGYICCSGGKILKTIDYGNNFSELTTSTINDLNDIQFVNDSSGYCIGEEGICIYTTDYGTTWTTDNVNTINSLKKIQMFSMENGFILNNSYNGFDLWRKNNPNVISNIQSEIISIYPNPASDFININFDSSTKISEISIYNMLGNKLYSNNIDLRKIDISTFDSGLYLILISADNKKYLTKILKQ